MHHPNAQVLTCWHAYVFTCILFPFPTHPSADLQEEYKSPISSIEYLCILIVPKCRTTYLFPYIFHHFLLIQVPTCWPARWILVPLHLVYISTSSKCWPANLPTCLTSFWCINLNCCINVIIPNPKWWMWWGIVQSFQIMYFNFGFCLWFHQTWSSFLVFNKSYYRLLKCTVLFCWFYVTWVI